MGKQPNFKMPHSSGRSKQVVPAGQATIQQWITATEQMVMGNRELIELVGSRTNLVAERVEVLKSVVQRQQTIIEQLVKGEEVDLSLLTVTKPDEPTEPTDA